MNLNRFAPMVPKQVYDYLTFLGKNWKGKGDIVEIGCWLGGVTYHIMQGLKQAGFDKEYHAFDKWKASEREVEKAKKYDIGLKKGQDLLPLYNENVKEAVTTYKGNIMDSIDGYQGGLVELLILDAPKKNPLFGKCIGEMKDYLIPGVTIVGFLDYYQYKKFPYPKRLEFFAPVALVERYPHVFEEIADFEHVSSCKFFRVKRELKYELD